MRRYLLIPLVLVAIYARYAEKNKGYFPSESGGPGIHFLITQETQTKDEPVTLQNGRYTIVLPKGVDLELGDLPRVEPNSVPEYTRRVPEDSNEVIAVLQRFFMRKRMIVGSKDSVENDPYMGKVLVSGLFRKIAEFQRKTRQIFTETLPSDHAFVISSMYIGGELRELSKTRADAFRASGLAHILSASGYNIVLVSSSIERIFKGRSLFARSAVLSGVWGFAMLAALSPSVVRAATTRSISLVAQGIGRPIGPVSALSIGTSIIIYIQPELIHSLSLWLSVGASFGILLFSKLINGSIPTTSIPIIRGFREDCVVSVSATLGVLPIQLLIFQQINPGAPLWNGLVGWSIGPMMAIGVGVAILSAFSLPTSWLTGILELLTDWMFLVAETSKAYTVELEYIFRK